MLKVVLVFIIIKMLIIKLEGPWVNLVFKISLHEKDKIILEQIKNISVSE
jgi:hypothetical protein